MFDMLIFGGVTIFPNFRTSYIRSDSQDRSWVAVGHTKALDMGKSLKWQLRVVVVTPFDLPGLLLSLLLLLFVSFSCQKFERNSYYRNLLLPMIRMDSILSF